MKLDFLKEFDWENEATDISLIEDGMRVVCAPNTDFWLDKSQKINKKNAAFFYTKKIDDFEIKAQFEPNDFGEFAQCGIMIKANDNNAFKISFMSSKINSPMIGTSLSVMGFSDWAIHPVESILKFVYYKVLRAGNVFFAYYSFDDITYHKIRQFSFVEPLIGVKVGAYFASPANKDYVCVLKDMEIK